MRRILLLALLGMILECHGQDKALIARIDSLMDVPNYEEAKKIIANASHSNPTSSTNFLLSNRLAEILISQGKLDQAETNLNALSSGTPTSDPFLNAITKTNLGFLYLNKARNDLALEYLQGALNLFQESGSQETEEAATCIADLALLYLSTGKLNQAEENGLIALQIRQRLKGQASEALAASYNDLGLIYSQTDTDKGLEYYEMALAVYEKLHGKGHPKIAIANTNIGLMYLKLKLYGDAVTNFENAESIWKAIYPEGHPNQALALVNLGMTYDKMGNKKAALGYFERGLAIYKKSYGVKHSDIAVVLNEIGILKSSENHFVEALQYFQEALCANAPSFNEKNLARNPKVTEYYNSKVMLYSLRLKAEALEARHYGKTLKFEDLKWALICLHSSDTLIDNIRYHSSDENDKLEVGASANEVYEAGVRMAASMSETTIDFQKYRQEAFYFAEKSKSAVLQESIADAEAKSFSGIPEALLDEEKGLKASIALLAQKLSQKPGEEEEKKLREDLFSANRNYAAFILRLEKNYPDYYNLKFNQVAPSISELQKIINGQTAIVSYFIAEKGQQLYIFSITQRSFTISHTTLPADFDRMVKGFNNSLFYTVLGHYRESSNKLSRLLLRGIPPRCKEIVIIPAGRLGTLPFEALSTRKLSPEDDFATASYLVRKFAVSYEFSAGLLLQKVKGAKQDRANSIFLCAPISFPAKDKLDDLPGTDQEVNNIAKLFSINTLVAKGLDANEGLIKSGKLADYRYLHFATHGVVDEESPELSRIFMQSSAQEDGNVFSGEIFNLKLNADLAVLSACQTGLGKYSKGEGVIGLSRALVYAGARNIMVSYWSVADASTSELMTDFYKRLLEQPQPDFREALQRAKLNMIQNKKYSAPYYWAPFVLIGF